MFTNSSNSNLARGSGRALNAHDLKRLRALLAEEFVLVDHRRTGLGRLDGADAYVAALAALFEQASDVRFEPLYFIAIAEPGMLALTRSLGTRADSGREFERVYVWLSHQRGGRLVGMEPFEPEHLEQARARFEQLRG